jgi:3-oxoacyl-[acyl-carrier protein] reductase
MILDDKVALVTGSTGGGMGRSIALTLARHGADVVLNYGTHRRGTDADAVAQAVTQAIRAMGRRALVVQADTRDADAVSTMVQQAVDAFGKVDILVNNAGGGWNPQDIADLSPEQFRDGVEAEANGAFHCIRACLPVMRRNGWGRIISLGAYGAGEWTDGPVEYATTSLSTLSIPAQATPRILRHWTRLWLS